MKNGDKVAKSAYSWLGTPHINMAKVRGRGVDCGMLLIACLEEAGEIKKDEIKIPVYSNEWHLHHSEEWFLSYIQKYCRQVKSPKKGDFFVYQYGRCVSHAGIYVGDGRIIHAVIHQGVILSSIDESMFFDGKGKSRLRGIYRFEGAK